MGMTPQISIVICTLRRPRHLEAALRACLALRVPEGAGTEILVVDNSPEASAKDLVLGLAADAPLPIRFVHEKRTSIAHARNTGIAASRAPLIAFLDDDMRPSAEWLVHVLRIMAAEERWDALIGAIEPVPEDGMPGDGEADPALLDLYRRDLRMPDGSPVRPRRSGYIAGVGTGNAVLRRTSCVGAGGGGAGGGEAEGCFDPAFGKSGGEDTDFFHRLGQRGLTVVWSSRSLAYEIVSPGRMTMRYASHVVFRGSRIFARVSIKNSRCRFCTSAALAMIATGQTLVRLLRYGVLRLMRPKRAPYAWVSLVGALGKMPFLPEPRPWWDVPR